jgi:hypothetical protein
MENAFVENLEVRSLLARPSEENGMKALVKLTFLVSDNAGVEVLYSRLALRRRRAPRENFSFQSLPSLRHCSVIC